jgi:hypothetical protein
LFDVAGGGKLAVSSCQFGPGDWSGTMFKRPIGLIWLIYLIVGIFIAWEHHYITVQLLKNIASALLAIFLWWLVLLGVNLHIH